MGGWRATARARRGACTIGLQSQIQSNTRMERTEPRAMKAVSYASRATDQRATYLRIYADANGETHMQDIDISLLPREVIAHPSRPADQAGAARAVRMAVSGLRPLRRPVATMEQRS